LGVVIRLQNGNVIGAVGIRRFDYLGKCEVVILTAVGNNNIPIGSSLLNLVGSNLILATKDTEEVVAVGVSLDVHCLSSFFILFIL
jgi:hypothetical protein